MSYQITEMAAIQWVTFWITVQNIQYISYSIEYMFYKNQGIVNDFVILYCDILVHRDPI